MILKSNNSSDIYPLRATDSSTPPHALLADTCPDLWHRRLDHLGWQSLLHLVQSNALSCNKSNVASAIFHACQLGRHVRLSFMASLSHSNKAFELLYCDLWTSPIFSISSFKYYLMCLDYYTHYLWTFLLCLKSETFSTLQNFFGYVSTHLNTSTQNIQCDNGCKFNNHAARSFFLSHVTHLNLSCPHTSQQNGKAECMLCTINDIMRSLLFQADLLPAFWIEALHMVACLLNRHPTKPLKFLTPYKSCSALLPHMRIFVCSVVAVILTFLQQHPTNSLLALPNASFLVIHLTPRGISA